jgi:hypothetical protein
MNAYHDQVVRPRMQAAETNADLAAEAIAEGLAWSRQMQVLGDADNPRHAEILARVEAILHNVMNEGWTDCTDHDLTAINKLLRVARWAALFGFAWWQEAQDKAFGCARFEVRFDSLITSAGSYSGTLQSGEHNGRWRTSATVTVPFLSMDAAGPLAFTQFSYSGSNTIHDTDPDCTSTTTGTGTAPGQLRAVVVPILGLNVREGETPPPPPVQVSTMVPGTARPTETYLRTPCNGPADSMTDSRWASFFNQMRPSTLHTFGEADQLEDLVGTKSWTSTRSSGGNTETEQTTVEVWHMPAE